MKILDSQRLFVAILALTSLPATAQSLTTLYAGGNSGSGTWTNQFDITVANPNGVRILAFDVNCENTRSGGVGSPFTLDVWVTQRGGTYLGNESNPAAWTHVSTGSGISGPMGTPTPVDVADFVLPPGTYGVALEYNGTAMSYTNGNGTNQTYSNADITLNLGSSTTGRFGTPIYTPRVWNGTIHYFGGNAMWRGFGLGCAGTVGIPTLQPAAGSLPQLGATFTVEIRNLPAGGAPVVVVVGFSNTSWGPFMLPFDLGGLGATGCSLLVSPDATAATGSPTTTATFQLGVPNRANLVGVVLMYQAIVVDVGANALNTIVTNGGMAYLGA